MMSPSWHTDCVFSDDQAHHDMVCRGSTDEGSVHRASRHHNWRQSNTTVQAWTSAPLSDAQRYCADERWQGLSAVVRPGKMEIVTHVALSRMDDDLRQRVLRDQRDAGLLKQAARAWHRALSAKSPDRVVWIGSRAEIDAVASAGSASLHTVVAALGLWHFGAMPAGSDGAVLRVVYRVDEEVPLYKPDWRHGYPNFYFASASGHLDAGRTRNLTTGTLHCKEWLAKLNTLDAQAHLTEAECLVPDSWHNHYDLAPLYWQTLAAEIQQSAQPTP